MAQTCADENVAFIEKRAGRMEICMKKILHLIFGRFFVVAMAIILQVLWLCVVLWQLSYKFTYVNLLVRVIAIIVVLVIVNKWTNPANKLSWTFLILLSPIFGLMVYFLFGRSGLTKHTRERMDAVNRQVEALFQRDSAVEKGLEKESRSAYLQSSYIDKWAGFPLYQNTQTKYYSCGEEMFPDMLEALRGAKHFIFLEYFIIEEGYMFNTILDILEEKAKAGVDVRFIYDDVGSINSISFGYYKKLQERGIPCVTFNPFKPLISVVMNNRDHRKILVIDGHTAFTGGINLADEYINEYEKYGHWKDSAVMLKGEGVWSFTMMFLAMWNFLTHSKPDEYSQYMPRPEEIADCRGEGLVVPFTDSPLDDEPVGENVYLNIINSAEDYVYITTPYLVIDNEMQTALILAAKSGIDVRIITPHIPDKWFVFAVTRAHYRKLVKYGVKIYEYTPGFIHAKNFVSDDKAAVVGTINLDFRSLYLHFECASWMYKCECIPDIKRDYLETLKVCQEITYSDCIPINIFKRIGRAILRLFAPMM